MAFNQTTIDQAWNRAGGHCQCRRSTHGHYYVRCNKQLVYVNRGREGRGCWEAHHINSNGGDGLANCEILCYECHVGTRSFGG